MWLPLAAQRLGRSPGVPSAALQPCGTWRAQPWGPAQPLSRQCGVGGESAERELLRSTRLAKWRRAGLRRRQDSASDEAGALEDTARHGVDRLDEVGGRADGTRLNLRLGCQGVRFRRRHQVRCTMPMPVWKAGANVQATCQQSVLTSSSGSQESTPGFFSMISAASSLPSMSTSTA